MGETPGLCGIFNADPFVQNMLCTALDGNDTFIQNLEYDMEEVHDETEQVTAKNFLRYATKKITSFANNMYSSCCVSNLRHGFEFGTSNVHGITPLRIWREFANAQPIHKQTIIKALCKASVKYDVSNEKEHPNACFTNLENGVHVCSKGKDEICYFAMLAEFVETQNSLVTQKLLKFVTNSSLMVKGNNKIYVGIQSCNTLSLPYSHTCMNILILRIHNPHGATLKQIKQTFTQNMLIAIECGEFSFI